MDFGVLLSQYGLPGIIIFALGCVVVILYKENKALVQKLFDVQEQRRLESLETSKELNQTMQTFSQASTMLIDKIQVARGEK
mgnify:CR=1 FL=1